MFLQNLANTKNRNNLPLWQILAKTFLDQFWRDVDNIFLQVNANTQLRKKIQIA
jgi:hypothetical protein